MWYVNEYTILLIPVGSAKKTKDVVAKRLEPKVLAPRLYSL
jgi:hypothetical protein